MPFQPQLILIYRPQRDGRLNRPWGEVTPAEIQTCNLPIANPALYHTATSAPVFRLQSNAVLISRKVPIHPSFEAWKSPAECWSTSHFLNSTSRRKLLRRKVPGQVRLPFYVYLNHQLTTTTTTVRFNDHFARGLGLTDTRMSPFWILLELRTTEMVVTTAAVRRAKLQSNCHHQQTNIQFFLQAECPSCRPIKCEAS